MQKEWSYFPHIPTERLSNDILAHIPQMQGQNGIYYVGGAWNFEATENAAESAKYVVETYFGPNKRLESR